MSIKILNKVNNWILFFDFGKNDLGGFFFRSKKFGDKSGKGGNEDQNNYYMERMKSFTAGNFFLPEICSNCQYFVFSTLEMSHT